MGREVRALTPQYSVSMANHRFQYQQEQMEEVVEAEAKDVTPYEGHDV